MAQCAFWEPEDGPITTRNAYQKMVKPANGGLSSWNQFVRVYREDLGVPLYSSLVVGQWDTLTQQGGGNTNLYGLFKVADGVVAVGRHQEDSGNPGNSKGNNIPVTQVPAWGDSVPRGQSAILVRYTASNITNPNDDPVVGGCVSTSATIAPVACGSYTVPSGNASYSVSGTYSDTLTNAAGCDSILTIDLTIETVDTSVTAGQQTLSANQAGGTYQWIFCDSIPVSGETAQTFTPSVNGNYAVIVTNGACTDTSNCHFVSLTGRGQSEWGDRISVFPNPTQGWVRIDLGEMYPEISVKVSNVMGQILQENSLKHTSDFSLNIDAPDGIYFVDIEINQEKVFRFKLLKI